MNRKQILVSATMALIALCLGLSSLVVPARENSMAKAAAALMIAEPTPAPTPKKRDIPVAKNTDTASGPAEPVALKGTIKFNRTGNNSAVLRCEEIEVIVNKASQTIAKVNASGDFLKGRCSFNITGLPANTPLALLVPKPGWVPEKCSQLQFDNQHLAIPALKPGVTKPVIINLKVLNCIVPT